LLDTSILERLSVNSLLPWNPKEWFKADLISSIVQSVSSTKVHHFGLNQPGKSHTKSGPNSLFLITYICNNSKLSTGIVQSTYYMHQNFATIFTGDGGSQAIIILALTVCEYQMQQ